MTINTKPRRNIDFENRTVLESKIDIRKPLDFKMKTSKEKTKHYDIMKIEKKREGKQRKKKSSIFYMYRLIIHKLRKEQT